MKLGFWVNNKHQNVYEVTGVGLEANNFGHNEYVVIYRNVKTRKVYTRYIEEFQEKFTFQNELDTPLQLLVTTLKQCRIEYLKMARENPLFGSQGGNKSFKYVVGDKIGFAHSIRLINTKSANILIGWLNGWTLEPNTSHEQMMLTTSEELAERLRRKS